MALFPPEFIGAVLFAFVQVRLKEFCGIASYLVSKLTFFLPPDDQLLQQLNVGHTSATAGQPKLSPQDKLSKFFLKCAHTERNTLEQTLFYEMYEILVLTASCVLFAVGFHDLWSFGMALVWPSPSSSTSDADLSSSPTSPLRNLDVCFYGLMVLLLIALWFPFQLRLEQGFRNFEAGLSLSIGFLGFVAAFFVLLAPKQWFEFDVEQAVEGVGARLELALQALGWTPQQIASVVGSMGKWLQMVFFCQIAVLAGMFAGSCFFPAFRFARMYTEMTKDKEVSIFKKLLLHFNMLSPLIICALYVKPLASSFVRFDTMTPCGDRQLFRDCVDANSGLQQDGNFDNGFWRSESFWQSMRLYLVLFSALARLISFHDLLQYFLLEPRESIVDLVQHSGPVPGELLKQKIRIQFNCIPIVAIQYLAPLFALVASAFALKHQTGLSLYLYETLAFFCNKSGLFDAQRIDSLMRTLEKATILLPLTNEKPNFGDFHLNETISSSKLVQIVQGMGQFVVFPPDFHLHFFSFAIWWISFCWFALSVGGLLYWRTMPSSGSAASDGTAAMTPKEARKLLKKKSKKQR